MRAQKERQLLIYDIFSKSFSFEMSLFVFLRRNILFESHESAITSRICFL